jgi:cytochrome c-type biogenesis protein
MGSGLTQTVISGPFLLAALLSLAAGAVSFASPCVVPLVPGYLSYLTSLVGAESAVAPVGVARGRTGTGSPGQPAPVKAAVRGRAVGATGLFVLGFTVVFVAQSVAVLGLSRALLANSETLMRVGGAITIVLGVAMLGLLRPLQTERRLHPRPVARLWGAPLLGAAFGLGWTVCLGPTLVGVLALANATDWGGSSWRGLFLVLFYCAGLGVPFLLLAWGFGWAGTAVGFLRRHSRAIQVVGAICLIVLGVLMVTGAWGAFVAWLQSRVAGVEAVI